MVCSFVADELNLFDNSTICFNDKNEWYPWGLQISLHIRSPAFSEMGGGYFGVNFGHLKSEVFQKGGVFRSKLWSSQI